jgi:putative lipoprotein
MRNITAAALLSSFLFIGCTDMPDTKPTASAVLSGNVIYLQRIALPPDAVVTVSLQDISKMDVKAELLGEQRIETKGRQVPIPFAIEYDSSVIDERMMYSVSARIEQDGQLLWINDTVHPVLTRGAPTDGIDLKVVPVKR